jgi:hypothetical protein
VIIEREKEKSDEDLIGYRIGEEINGGDLARN